MQKARSVQIVAKRYEGEKGGKGCRKDVKAKSGKKAKYLKKVAKHC